MFSSPINNKFTVHILFLLWIICPTPKVHIKSEILQHPLWLIDFFFFSGIILALSYWSCPFHFFSFLRSTDKSYVAYLLFFPTKTLPDFLKCHYSPRFYPPQVRQWCSTFQNLARWRRKIFPLDSEVHLIKEPGGISPKLLSVSLANNPST